MHPTQPSTNATPGITRAAELITGFRDELSRCGGLTRPEAIAIIASPIGEAVLRKELGLVESPIARETGA